MADLQSHQYSQNLIPVNVERIFRVHICKEKKYNFKEKKMIHNYIQKSDQLYKFKNLISYTNENLMDFRGKPGFGNFTKLPEREPS